MLVKDVFEFFTIQDLGRIWILIFIRVSLFQRSILKTEPEQIEKDFITQAPFKKVIHAFANKTNSNSDKNTNKTSKNVINMKENRYNLSTRYQRTDKYSYHVLIECNEGKTACYKSGAFFERKS